MTGRGCGELLRGSITAGEIHGVGPSM